MAYGKLEYNEAGLVKCEICDKFFKRPLPHARQKHDISAYNYKKKFGFETIKGICSAESAELSRKANKANYALVVTDNLIKGGKSTRFEEGCAGRTRDKVSKETLIKLQKHWAKVSNTKKE